MSYEHCTVYEDHKEKEKKDPQIKCRVCNNGVYKEAPTRIAISNFVLLRCNQCKTTLKGFKDNEGFKITKQACEECGCAQVKANYPVRESPFPFFANQHIGCIYCDNVMRHLMEFPETSQSATDQKEEEKTEKVEKPSQEKLEENPPVIIISKKKKKKRR